MVLYNFRLTHHDHETLKLVILWFRSKSQVYLAVQEISRHEKKLHIHMIFETDKKSTLFQQFHVHFKNMFKGNQSFSCEELKKELVNNYIYLCKGTRIVPPVVLFFNEEKITQFDIDGYWNKYWEDKPIEEDKTLIHNKIKKNKCLSWSEQLTLDIRKSNPSKLWNYDKIDIELLCDFVLKALGTQSKKLSSFIVRDLVLGQLNALNPHCLALRNKLLSEGFSDLSF